MGLIVDSFAGGGGASTGIEMALGRSPDIAINHDAEAIAMHTANHSSTRHYIEDVWNVDPREATGGKAVDLLWLSPDCKHFSKAKGGKPREKKIRGLAWLAVRWAKSVRPAVIMLENVEEFITWGPLLDDGMPCPERKGLTFRRFVASLTSLGYIVDWREMRACDFGAPTSRKRLFLVARCDGRPIVWPEPTHGPGRAPYRTAADCIDFNRPCPSIFGRKRELAEATKRRIARGVMRYVVNSPEPFIVTMRGTSEAHISASAGSIREPLRTASASGNHHALVMPFLTECANASAQRNFSAAEPLRTQCAEIKGGHFALVAPTLINTRNGERAGQAPRVHDIRQPAPTVTAQGSQGAVVAAFLARHYGGHENDGSDLRIPMHTVTAKDHHALVAAFLMKYYGADQDPRLDQPLHTITTLDRFALVTVRGEPYYITDIGMRMLDPEELKLAQGFPASYILNPPERPLTKKAQVRMIGNSVSPHPACALVSANLVDVDQRMAA
jgi:DNA (cytosine-5)-methyltransferase 1